ncbi:MAG TPA: DUF4118 domain-containing protein, partial [Dissulfurispiraceae bacterium]|nr:DUF4118 domain-containing protein [Dissulfurispiraceae bacterium]
MSANWKPAIHSSLKNYGLAIAFTIFMTLVRWGLGPYLDRPAMILFIIPVVFSAYSGGFGPGLLATVLS